jgi:hypothetical protein
MWRFIEIHYNAFVMGKYETFWNLKHENPWKFECKGVYNEKCEYLLKLNGINLLWWKKRCDKIHWKFNANEIRNGKCEICNGFVIGNVKIHWNWVEWICNGKMWTTCCVGDQILWERERERELRSSPRSPIQADLKQPN